MQLRSIATAFVPIAIVLTATALTPGTVDAALKKCLFVSSYHRGYAWSDGVERGLRSVLEGRCEIKQFDMDTKRKKSPAQIRESALRAKALIESWRPDVVIAADDNASKNLIVPFYKNHSLPFVFCAVNWTAEEYGFPFDNVTGMIEVAPIAPTLERAAQVVPNLKRAFYIGADTLTESKNLKRYEAAARRLGLTLDHALAGSLDAWLAAHERAQDHDLVIIGSNAGINDWNDARAQAGALRSARKLSVTNMKWMMPYTILGLTKVPEEQGEWAAKAALQILDGMSPRDIPIIANNRRDIWLNTAILSAARMTLPDELMNKSKKIGWQEPQVGTSGRPSPATR